MADYADKSFKFRVVYVYALNITAERCSFFWWFEPFLDDSKQLILVGDWNAILEPKIDKAGRGASRLDRYKSSLIDLLAEHNLVVKFRLDHPGQEMWMWLDNLLSGQVCTYLDRVLGEPTLNSFLVPGSTVESRQTIDSEPVCG